MADSPITGLPELFITSLTDVLAIDDLDTSTTKKIKIQNLMLYPGPIGAGAANTGEFTTLQLPSGATINEFSIDGTLGGNSDLALPTEKAVKTYVDAQIAATDEHNELIGLQGGDSTADEFYHLTQSIHDGLFSASPIIGLGNSSGTNLQVDYGSNRTTMDISAQTIFDADNEEIILGITSGIRLRIDYADDEVFKFYDNTGTERLRVGENGIRLNSATAFVNEFSIDGTLSGNSDDAVPTEKAVKTYVDNVQSLDTINGSWEVVNGDSTATILFDVAQLDSQYSVVGNLVNEVDGSPSIYAHIITEKTTIGFTVLFSGLMDSSNYKFDWLLSRMLLASSSSRSSSSSSSSSSSRSSSSSSSSAAP